MYLRYTYTQNSDEKLEKAMNNESQRQIHIKMPYKLHRKLRVEAAVRETTIQDYVVNAIKDQLGKGAKKVLEK